ncbi:hypothetical protein DPV78_001354 [Talaromyces pinophilus]|nr:hypothetical protein DPV78_001354 [Talaromyces pinophilus]
MATTCADKEAISSTLLMLLGKRVIKATCNLLIAHVGEVPEKDVLINDPKVRVFHGNGRTLIPALGGAHTHMSWNGGDLDRWGELGVEEHMLLTARSARCFLDSVYTMCFGAASAKKRLDVVIRDGINAGNIPGPRCLANGQEMAKGLVGGITAFANGPDEMRQVCVIFFFLKSRVHILLTFVGLRIREHVELGVDQIKLSMSGESITEIRDAEDCYFTNEETQVLAKLISMASDCAHARARVCPTMSQPRRRTCDSPCNQLLVATLYEAGAFGYATEVAEKVVYKKELNTAIVGLREMHRRGIVVLPGGSYGFAWRPHGTYARDLEHFTKLPSFTAHEAILAATYGVAKVFMRSHEMGQIKPGNFADFVIVDGDLLKDITIVQYHAKLDIIMINGRVHKAGRKAVIPQPYQRVSDKTAKLEVLEKVGATVPMQGTY